MVPIANSRATILRRPASNTRGTFGCRDVVYAKASKAWRVEVTGNKRASGSHAIKPQAVAQGRQLASRNKLELVIHNQDGKIGERRTYGRDPFPPRG